MLVRINCILHVMIVDVFKSSTTVDRFLLGGLGSFCPLCLSQSGPISVKVGSWFE